MDAGVDAASCSSCPRHHAVTTTSSTAEEDGEDPLLPGRTARPGLVVAGVDQNQNQCGLSPSEAADAATTSGSVSPKKTRFAPERGSEPPADSPSKVNGEAKEATPPSDEELLRRLEEANRMLEADEKSRAVLSALSSTTPGHSRKGSGSSIVSSTSSNSFYSTQNSAENDDNNEVARVGGEKHAFSPQPRHHHHHHHHHQQQQPRHVHHHHHPHQLQPRRPPSPTRSALRPPRALTHQRSSSLDSRKSSRSASDPVCPFLEGSPPGSHLLRPVPLIMRRVGSSQSVATERAAGHGHGAARKGSSGSVGRRGSLAAERPISPSLSDLLFRKVPSPPQHIAVLWDALNSINTCGGTPGGQSETLWEIWGRIINDFDTVKKRPAFLKELVRKGIPHEFRGMAWQLVLGVHDSPWKQEYREHMKKTSPCEKLIRRDIARTFPEHDFFKEKDGFGQESLFNVMKAYSLHDREVGYCQGSGFIVGLLLMQMPEEDAFAVMVRLMQDFRLRELFKPSMAELGLCMYKLECLIQELLPTLLVHFQTQNFDTSMYASSWFLTLFVTSLPLSLARRIMDLFVSEGMEMIFRVGVAILQMCQEDLLALDMEGLLKYLQKDLRNRFEQDSDQDNLLQTAYSIKYNHKKMKK
ncbi:hypothetical protein RRG08_030719 [Elysia crispata]|uniref:Rab-GAP TBC domain-containing protein n=1 Tax=Elysia crispata TaxID=231223 RepID=A0AAE1CSH4_9GAST|nr:hypothetical protein RRG08_030719 [Elysia crispata]